MEDPQAIHTLWDTGNDTLSGVSSFSTVILLLLLLLLLIGCPIDVLKYVGMQSVTIPDHVVRSLVECSI